MDCEKGYIFLIFEQDRPDYLILDEPFYALDKSSQKVVLDLIEEYL